MTTPTAPYELVLCAVCNEYTFAKDLGTRYRKENAHGNVVLSEHEYGHEYNEQLRDVQLGREGDVTPLRWHYRHDDDACPACRKPGGQGEKPELPLIGDAACCSKCGYGGYISEWDGYSHLCGHSDRRAEETNKHWSI
jgi:hypothetical protein